MDSFGSFVLNKIISLAMTDRSKTGIKRFFDQRPSTPPPWPDYGQPPESEYANLHAFALAADHTWNDTSRSSKENLFSEKEQNSYVIKYNLNSSLIAMSASPDHGHVVVAGREGSINVFFFKNSYC